MNRKRYLAYACVCVIWGSTWSAGRLLVRDVPPLRAAAVRFVLASIILLGIALVRRTGLRLSARHWRALIILGFTMMALPYAFLLWAGYRISSSITVLLLASGPLFVTLFTRLLTRTRVPRSAICAMLIALGGMIAIFYTGLSVSKYVLLGGGAVVLAVLLSSWSLVFAKGAIGGIDPVMGTGVQSFVSSVVLLGASFIVESGRPSDWNETSLLALVFLTIFGSAIAFSLYYWLLAGMHAYQLSTINLVVPLIAIAEGSLLLREPIPLATAGAGALILIAVAIVLRAADDEQTLGLGIVNRRDN